MTPVFLERYYPVLLLAHLGATMVLMGALVHHFWCVVGYVRGQFNRQNLEKRYARVLFWAYLVTYGLGALIYPAYRIYIRHLYFDPQLPWATGLFEVKEHWGALALALVAVLYGLRKTFQPAEARDMLRLYIPLCFLVNLIVWYKVIVGCYLTILKGSWS